MKKKILFLSGSRADYDLILIYKFIKDKKISNKIADNWK